MPWVGWWCWAWVCVSLRTACTSTRRAAGNAPQCVPSRSFQPPQARHVHRLHESVTKVCGVLAVWGGDAPLLPAPPRGHDSLHHQSAHLAECDVVAGRRHPAGGLRHGTLIPWDTDADIAFLVRRVCPPPPAFAPAVHVVLPCCKHPQPFLITWVAGALISFGVVICPCACLCNVFQCPPVSTSAQMAGCTISCVMDTVHVCMTLCVRA
mmetsp:Transcript_13041/g.33292  ORF Transcript_13041/g.33292 Transcript_13041/m.33292 type:complete len:209 (+) Transcript_13041:114-740(+)